MCWGLPSRGAALLKRPRAPRTARWAQGGLGQHPEPGSAHPGVHKPSWTKPWGTRASPELSALSQTRTQNFPRPSQPELAMVWPLQHRHKAATKAWWSLSLVNNQQWFSATWLLQLFLFQCYWIHISSASSAQFIMKTFQLLLCQLLQYVIAKWVKELQMPLYPTICF